jgi:hypothetical protein
MEMCALPFAALAVAVVGGLAGFGGSGRAAQMVAYLGARGALNERLLEASHHLFDGTRCHRPGEPGLCLAHESLCPDSKIIGIKAVKTLIQFFGRERHWFDDTINELFVPACNARSEGNRRILTSLLRKISQ